MPRKETTKKEQRKNGSGQKTIDAHMGEDAFRKGKFELISLTETLNKMR